MDGLDFKPPTVWSRGHRMGLRLAVLLLLAALLQLAGAEVGPGCTDNTYTAYCMLACIHVHCTDQHTDTRHTLGQGGGEEGQIPAARPAALGPRLAGGEAGGGG